MSGPKILVTGASGHLGANLVHRLLDDWQNVRVLLRQGSNNEAMSGLDVERVYADLSDPDSLRDAVDGCAQVYHTAALVSTKQGNRAHKRRLFETNVLGTRRVLEAARAAEVERVVVTSTLGATGYDLDDPTRAADESAPFYPFAAHMPYEHTKFHVEHECLRAATVGLDVVMVVSTAILGPHDYKPSPMGRTLIDYASGKLWAYIPGGFPFVSGRDIADAHVRAMARGRAGEKYIIATAYLTVDDLMDIYEEVTSVPRPKLRLPPAVMQVLANVTSAILTRVRPKVTPRFTPDAVRILRLQRRADTSKARRELGFEPGDIRQAVADAYEDFLRRGLVPVRRGGAAQWSPRTRAEDEDSEPAGPEVTRPAAPNTTVNDWYSP